MAEALVTAGLGRKYGKTWALRDLDLTIERGSIFGLLGSNGAGKTTTLRMLSTLLLPSVGRAWIDGFDVMREPRLVRSRVGYMPDSFGVYDDLTVTEYLEFYATAHGVRRHGRDRLLRDLLTVVGLEHRADGFVDVLSRGMKQRLGLARCLVHDPPVVLLDEPASGLDPLARHELQAILRELAAMGKTVVISSHILPELGELCSHAGIVEGGRLLVQGTVVDLLARENVGRKLIIDVDADETAVSAATLLEGEAGVTAVDVEGTRLSATLTTPPEADHVLFGLLGRARVPVLRFGRQPASLEDVYFSATGNAGIAAS